MQMWLQMLVCLGRRVTCLPLARSEPFHSVCASLLLLLLFLFCFMLVCVFVVVLLIVVVAAARWFLDFYCKNANVGRF